MRDYKEMLEKAKVRYDEIKGTSPSEEKFLLDMFSELAESDDEIIRKGIISTLKFANHKGVYDKYISWLEKQGEEKSQSDSKKLSEQIKDFEGEFGCWNSAQDFRPKHLQRCLCYDKYMKGVYCYVYDDISKYWCTQTTEEHDTDGDNHICDYADYRVTVWMQLPDTSFYPSKSWLEKQGESTLIEEIKRRKELYSREKEKAVSFAEKLSLGGRISMLEELLVFANEKQSEHKLAEWHREDEQNLNACLGYIPDEFLRRWLMDIIHTKYDKPIDKVEPKFKIGDFIVNDYCSGRVVELTDDAYLLDTGQGIPFSCEHNIHLWSIQDAKDGDVLSTSKKIFIYNGNYNTYSNTIGAYCSVKHNGRGLFIPEEDEEFRDCIIMRISDATPATKEQCDLLFQKMKEEGYEWDDEREEIKKIPKFNVGDWVVDEEDNTIFQIVEVLDNTYTYKTIEGKEYFCTHYSLENDVRSWTIQDAKPGDVLACCDNKPFIFKGFFDLNFPNCLAAYCGVTLENQFGHCNGKTFWTNQDVKPATKEQCNLLFQKMHEAGYEWDAEKKELKKIENKPDDLIDNMVKEVADWSEKDEENLQGLLMKYNKFLLNHLGIE